LPRRLAFCVTSLDDMRALALDGLGITVLPDYFVRAELANKALVELHGRAERTRRAGREARSAIYLAWRKGAIETSRLRLAREALLAPASH
jgi:DNA-binding transcriptional LysR family regulator